jgi:hypothetical protein
VTTLNECRGSVFFVAMKEGKGMKGDAIVKAGIEPDELAEADEKRRQFFEALRRGDIGDPISAVVAFVGVKALIGAGISLGVSLGAGPLSRSLPPRGKDKR